MVPGRAMRSSSFFAARNGSFATLTDRKSVVVPSRPSRYSFRQRNTWLAFTSCRRATLETETPGSSVSSTIARRSVFVRHRFFRTGSACSGVSTISPCGLEAGIVEAMAGRDLGPALEKIRYCRGRLLRTVTMGSVNALLRRWPPRHRQLRSGTIVACGGFCQTKLPARYRTAAVRVPRGSTF